MEQRRKIIIPTGADPEETLSTPHFDTEATLSARPVVPLAEPVALPPEDAYSVQQQVGAAYPPAPPTASSPWKRSTLILIILAAVGLGIASGLAIGLYQSRTTKASAPVVAQPSASDETQQAARQPEPQLEQPPVVNEPETPQPEEEVQIPPAPPVEEPESEPADDAVDNDDDKQSSRENRKRDETRSTPPVDRDKPAVYDPDVIERDEREERRARREERRERRREERREERRRQREQNEDDPLDVPRNIERARQEINRIRDIFEGRQP
ncbi:MAG: hypothetical protein ICV68_00750 [Pyrinomonadaceae bacterium]|nr:hypothetical protein [Pyrinomonadaceae bacterium]